MGVTTTQTNKPLNPRGNDQSPLAYNRAKLFSGKALDFDGVNDRLDGGSVAALGTGDFSYSVCFNPDGFATYHGLFAIGDIYNFGLLTKQTTGEIYAYSTTTENIDSGYLLKDGEWQNITFVRSGTSHKFYINGVLFSDITDTAFSVSAGNYKIGQVTAYFANGQYSNARLFNTALTAAQVADLYNNPEKVVPTGVDNTALKLWLPMQEGAGTTAYDGSGNGNHGTISGATYVNGVGAPVSQTAVIDWNKGTNNQAYSEIANNVEWSKENVTITSDVINAPNGTLTADKIVASSGNTFHFSGQAQSLPNAKNYTASIYAKAAEYEHLYICLRTDNGAKRYGVKFDLVNGTIVDDDTFGSPTNTGYNITSVGDGWYRCEVTSYHTSGDVTALYGPSPGGAVNGINNTFTGNDVNGIYIWGAQINEGTTAGIYVPTIGTLQPTPVLLPQGLTSGRDITGVNLFENVRKQGALNLDGNSWAEVHDNASLDVTTGVSVEAWVDWVSPSASKGILAKWGSSTALHAWLFQARSNSAIRLYIYDGTNYLVESSTLTEGWRHLCATYDGVTLRMYIDGQADTTTAHTASIPSVQEPVKIGAYGVVTSLTYEHAIAQPRIYNRALTAAEVLQNYNSGKNTYTNN